MIEKSREGKKYEEIEIAYGKLIVVILTARSLQ